MNLELLCYWINERESLRIKKESGENPPWTLDPILANHRMCNVRREDDRVTRWIKEHIRTPYEGHPHLWYMLCIARQLNWPDTLEELITRGAWPSNKAFHPLLMTDVLMDRKARGEKVYTGAFMIRAENDRTKFWGNWPKQRYTAEVVLGQPWSARGEFSPVGLEEVCNWLQQFRGWGAFMAYQAVVDMRFTSILAEAPDRDWAAAGPGTIRGLNHVFGREPTKQLRQEQTLDEIRAVYAQLRKDVDIEFDFSDVPNILCEVSKYVKVRDKKGQMRQKYRFTSLG